VNEVNHRFPDTFFSTGGDFSFFTLVARIVVKDVPMRSKGFLERLKVRKRGTNKESFLVAVYVMYTNETNLTAETTT